MLVINTDSCTTPSLDAQALHLLTHSLNATIDQLRVVVSSTLTDAWPRSGPSSRVAPVLLQLVGAMDDVVCQVGNWAFPVCLVQKRTQSYRAWRAGTSGESADVTEQRETVGTLQSNTYQKLLATVEPR